MGDNGGGGVMSDIAGRWPRRSAGGHLRRRRGLGDSVRGRLRRRGLGVSAARQRQRPSHQAGGGTEQVDRPLRRDVEQIGGLAASGVGWLAVPKPAGWLAGWLAFGSVVARPRRSRPLQVGRGRMPGCEKCRRGRGAIWRPGGHPVGGRAVLHADWLAEKLVGWRAGNAPGCQPALSAAPAARPPSSAKRCPAAIISVAAAANIRWTTGCWEMGTGLGRSCFGGPAEMTGSQGGCWAAMQKQ